MEGISLRLKKILRLVVVLILLTISLSESTIAVVQPETPLLNGNLIWNIESVYYHIDVSANSYATPIADAAYNWANTGYGWNRLNPNTRTYNIMDSTIDIYGYSFYDGNNAYTEFWARTNGNSGEAYEVNPDNEDWLFNKVKLNNCYLSGETNGYRQGVVAHEMGHCFGLDENNENQYSIMCQLSYGRAVTTVRLVDHNAFNRKHP